MKILTVDDHPLTRTGIESMLRNTFRQCEIWGSGRTKDAIELAARIKPDLILLDLHLPEPPSSAETCRQLLDRGITAPIVIITAFEDDDELRSCLAAGASGCLLKDASAASMSAALRRAVDGERVFDPRIQKALASQLLDDLQGGRPRGLLTARETEILGLIADGKSNREISSELFVTESTVKWHVRKLMEKLDARSRWQAVVHAKSRGLI